jgi:hypothetical protein
MILQLNPPLWFDTPKGPALAHFVVDTSMEHEMEFVCVHQNGEAWSWSQRDVLAASNMTIGRDSARTDPPARSQPLTVVEGREQRPSGPKPIALDSPTS